MKKLLLLASTLFISSLNLMSQSSILVTLSGNGSTVTNNATFYVTADPTALAAETDFSFKNISVSTKTLAVKRTDIHLNKVSSSDSAEAYFCTGLNCYPASITVSPDVILNANASESLKTYLQEASVEGTSDVKYEVYDVNNPTDKLSFTISYNNILSVKNLNSVFANVSDVYPNPSANKTQIAVYINNNVNNGFVTISNSLGSVVSSKHVELSSGKNIIHLDSENLSTGIYFATITSNNQKIVKKFTITK